MSGANTGFSLSPFKTKAWKALRSQFNSENAPYWVAAGTVVIGFPIAAAALTAAGGTAAVVGSGLVLSGLTLTALFSGISLVKNVFGLGNWLSTGGAAYGLLASESAIVDTAFKAIDPLKDPLLFASGLVIRGVNSSISGTVNQAGATVQGGIETLANTATHSAQVGSAVSFGLGMLPKFLVVMAVKDGMKTTAKIIFGTHKVTKAGYHGVKWTAGHARRIGRKLAGKKPLAEPKLAG
jgi:hypothetical protein